VCLLLLRRKSTVPTTVDAACPRDVCAFVDSCLRDDHQLRNYETSSATESLQAMAPVPTARNDAFGRRVMRSSRIVS